MTAPVIAAANEQAANEARYELMPQAGGFTQVAYNGEGVTEIYSANSGEGVIITCTAKGYGGDIVVLVALDSDGMIQRIKIQEQSETVGIGTKIEDESFWGSFSGLPAQPLTVDDINAISGATISSKAVTKAVNYALDAFDVIS